MDIVRVSERERRHFIISFEEKKYQHVVLHEILQGYIAGNVKLTGYVIIMTTSLDFPLKHFHKLYYRTIYSSILGCYAKKKTTGETSTCLVSQLFQHCCWRAWSFVFSSVFQVDMREHSVIDDVASSSGAYSAEAACIKTYSEAFCE